MRIYELKNKRTGKALKIKTDCLVCLEEIIFDLQLGLKVVQVELDSLTRDLTDITDFENNEDIEVFCNCTAREAIKNLYRESIKFLYKGNKP